MNIVPLHKKEIGKAGEDKAAEYLKENGYKIIERNWHTRFGEIDIIAQKNDIIVFVEVKTLPNGDAETLERVLGKHKQKKILETAKCFLNKYRQYSNSIIRFDVLVVDMPGFPLVYHIENAFSEQL